MPIGFTRLQAFGYRAPIKQAEANNPPSLQMTHADQLSFSGQPGQQKLHAQRRLFDPRRLLSRLWRAILAPIRWPLARFGLGGPRQESAIPTTSLAAFREKLAEKNPFALPAGTLARPAESTQSSSGPAQADSQPAISAGDAPVGDGPHFGRAANPFAATPVGVGTAQPVQETERLPEPQRLWDAVHAGEAEAVRELIAGGLDVNLRQSNGETPLHHAVDRGNLPLVLALLDAPQIKVNAADRRGTRPIHSAVRENHPEIVDALSRRGADLEADSWYENRPLQLAAELGHDAVAQRLLQQGADVNGQSWQGYMPLYWAARRGHAGLVKTLLAHDADVATPDRYGETPLHGAAYGGHLAVTQALLDTGKALPNVADYRGETPLHLAARRDHLRVLALLTARGGDLHRPSLNGGTPQDILDKRRQIRAHRAHRESFGRNAD